MNRFQVNGVEELRSLYGCMRSIIYTKDMVVNTYKSVYIN